MTGSLVTLHYLDPTEKFDSTKWFDATKKFDPKKEFDPTEEYQILRIEGVRLC